MSPVVFLVILFLLINHAFATCSGIPDYDTLLHSSLSLKELIILSEENPDTDRFSSLLSGVICDGRFCSEKSIYVHGADYPILDTSAKVSTDFFGDGLISSGICPRGTLVNKLECRGQYCSSMRLGCASTGRGYIVDEMDESLENGRCDKGSYIKGVVCEGDYCENLKVLCVKVYRTKRVEKNVCRVLEDAMGRVMETAWFSEEGGGYSDLVETPITGIKCSGRYCDRKKLVALNEGVGKGIIEKNGYWTEWFSEEGRNFAVCDWGYIVSQVRCKGRYCDQIRLKCVNLKKEFNAVGGSQSVMRPVSEEQGGRNCALGKYVNGMTCMGRYCDDIELHCVSVTCKK